MKEGETSKLRSIAVDKCARIRYDGRDFLLPFQLSKERTT